MRGTADRAQPGSTGSDTPTAIWYLDNHDEHTATDTGDRLTARLRNRLIHTYTSPGDAVVDVNPQTRTVSACTSRTLTVISSAADLADLDALAEPVSLILLHWPPAQTSSPGGISDLFTACRLIATAGTCTVAVILPAAGDRPALTIAEELDALTAAAATTGLGHARRIIGVPGEPRGDRFVYYAGPADIDMARHGGPDSRATRHVDVLLVSSDPGQPRDAR